MTIYREVVEESGGDLSSCSELERKMWAKITGGQLPKSNKLPWALVKKNIKMQLPYMPDIINYNSGCQGLKKADGLYIPCGGKCEAETVLCVACTKVGAKYGTLEDRGAPGSYMDPEDKHEITYGTWLAKKEKTIEDVCAAITEGGFDFVIPESFLAVNAKRAEAKHRPGRPKVKKEVSESDDESSSDTEAKVKAPKKAKAAKKAETDSETDEPKAPKGKANKAKSDDESESDEPKAPKGKAKKAKADTDSETVEPKAKAPKKAAPKKAAKKAETDSESDEPKAPKKAKAKKAETDSDTESEEKPKKKAAPKAKKAKADSESDEPKAKAPKKATKPEPEPELEAEDLQLGEEPFEEENDEDIEIDGNKFKLRNGRMVFNVEGEWVACIEDGDPVWRE
jgi:hypothetical protein